MDENSGSSSGEGGVTIPNRPSRGGRRNIQRQPRLLWHATSVFPSSAEERGHLGVKAKGTTALITCGALAREVLQLKAKHGWDADVFAVPALLHNHPDRLPAAIEERLHAARQQYEKVVVVYGDCGTGGQLDRLLESEGVQRIRGPHCYEIYGAAVFEELMAKEPGTFFLTDFLVSQFDALVIQQLGLDRFPELRDDYFGNYTRVVYLAQRSDSKLDEEARQAARQLNLPLEIRQVGYGSLESRLLEFMAK